MDAWNQFCRALLLLFFLLLYLLLCFLFLFLFSLFSFPFCREYLNLWKDGVERWEGVLGGKSHHLCMHRTVCSKKTFSLFSFLFHSISSSFYSDWIPEEWWRAAAIFGENVKALFGEVVHFWFTSFEPTLGALLSSWSIFFKHNLTLFRVLFLFDVRSLFRSRFDVTDIKMYFSSTYNETACTCVVLAIFIRWDYFT